MSRARRQARPVRTPRRRFLEGRCALLVANAAHIQAVHGRKTDVKDAE